MKRLFEVIAFSVALAEMVGADWVTTEVPVENNPRAIAVNPVTNKIYVGNNWETSVTVIDGASHTGAIVPVAGFVRDAAVNPVTNRIYVPDQSGDRVIVIDGATDETLVGSNLEITLNSEPHIRARLVQMSTNRNIASGLSHARCADYSLPSCHSVRETTSHKCVADMQSQNPNVCSFIFKDRCRIWNSQY